MQQKPTPPPAPQLIELEHLAKLADDRWREYDSKSQAEWKLSYAVWATLLAATASVITGGDDGFSIPSGSLVWIIGGFAFMALIAHWVFLGFIDCRLHSLREEMREILRRRRRHLDLNFSDDDEKVSGRISLRIQVFITFLLAGLLIGTAYVVTQ